MAALLVKTVQSTKIQKVGKPAFQFQLKTSGNTVQFLLTFSGKTELYEAETPHPKTSPHREVGISGWQSKKERVSLKTRLTLCYI